MDARFFLEALPDPALLLRASGVVLLNTAARERLSEGIEVGVGADWAALFPVDTAGILQTAAQKAFAGQPSRLQVPLGQAAAQATVSPVGEGLVMIHLREASQPLPLIASELLDLALETFDQLNLGMVVQGTDGQIIHANQAAQDALGLTLAQLTGRDSLDPRWKAIHPDGTAFPGEQHPAMQALQTGQLQQKVPMGVFHPPSESWRWLSVTAIPRLLPGSAVPDQVTVIFEDVTEQERTQSELRRSEQRFRSLVETSTQVVWTTNAQGHMTAPQPGWEAFSGQGPAQYTADGWEHAIHPEDRERVTLAWEESLRTLQPYRVEQRVLRKDGVYVPMQTYAVPLRDADGTVREWIGMDTDISAILEAQQALKTLNADLERRVHARTQEVAQATRFTGLLLSAAGEGVFGVDLQGRTTFANPAAAELLGYTIEQFLGADKHALIHHHHADGTPYAREDSPIYQTLHDGQTRRVESDVLWHAQGYAIPVSYVAAPIQDDSGQVTGAVVLVQDITDRLHAQAELQEAMRDLERSNQELEQFAYVASHDLQEPLRTLGSYAELLVRRYQGQLDPRADQYLAFIQAAVERMRSLIQDLLGFARVGRETSETQQLKLDLDAVMKTVALNVEAAVKGTHAQLHWDMPHRVRGHRSLITQLLTNLVSNALKFTPPQRPPQVQVTSHDQGKFIRVSVQDNGIGIEPQYHERVFDIFQRLHRRETYAGNGMGLAICRKIVEHHGGQLWLDSTPEQGSTFHFTLPAAAGRTSSTEPE